MTSETSFNLVDFFLSDERLETLGQSTAIEFREQHFTYEHLKAEVSRWADELSSRGVKQGDRVAVLLYDSPEFIACFLATASLGAICVPINTFFNQEEVGFILSDSGATLLIAEQELVERHFKSNPNTQSPIAILSINEPGRSIVETRRVESAVVEVLTTRQTPAILLYTSGSTGTPKGALHVQGNLVETIKGFGRNVLQLLPSDKVFSASRLYFAYGLGNSLSFPLAAGATVILVSERPTPQLIAEVFRKQRPTVFFAVPAVYRALLDLHAKEASVDTTSLRMCVSAGEALPATIFAEWQTVFGLTILDGIGSTEMLHMFISNREGEAKAGSSGKVVPGYEVRILDDSGQTIPIGEQGNLWVKGASAMVGYWQRDELTAAVIRDGWMRTGDVYRQDDEDYYFHIGRSDDCFKVKGLWVSPIEIETVLASHPEVIEAAVVASTDENGLATAKAYLVIRNDRETLKGELYEFARGRLPVFKIPTQYEFVSEMPRTSTGKIQRFRLRESK